MNNAEMKIEQLEAHLSAGEIQQALEIIGSPVTVGDYRPGYSFWSGSQANHTFAKSMVYTVLGSKNPDKAMIDAAINRFVDSRENEGGAHGYWVHSLSHLTEKFWKLGLKDWIKRLNDIAFTGANEFADNNCCNRLMNDFLYNAPWDAIPAEYGLTEESLHWTTVTGRYDGDTTTPESGAQLLERVWHFPYASKEAWQADGGIEAD